MTASAIKPPTTSSPGLGERARSALEVANKAMPPEMREQAIKLAERAKGAAVGAVNEAVDTGKNFAIDCVVEPLHRFLQMAKIIPGADELMLKFGKMLSEGAAKFIPPSQKIIIPPTIFHDICFNKEKVSVDIANQLDALRQHPSLKGFLDTISSPEALIAKITTAPGELIAKCQEIFGMNTENAAAKPQPAAASKPAAKTADAEKGVMAFLKSSWKRITDMFGSAKDTKGAKDKNVTGIKAMWEKIPPSVRKLGIGALGIYLAWHVLAFLWPVVLTVGTFLGAGFVGLKTKNRFWGGNKADAPSSGRSLFKPLTWLRSSKKETSPMAQAEAAAATPQQQAKSGGIFDMFKKHAGSIAEAAKAVGSGDIGALAGVAQKMANN